MSADVDLKTKWESANQRARRRSQSTSNGTLVTESPVASTLDLDVHSSISREALRQKIDKYENKRPGWMRMSYKGCCLVELKPGFPKFYKKVLGEMLTAQVKKNSNDKPESKSSERK